MAGIEQIKQVILVASGKGGVGKSTVAVNLALALARQGSRVGLLDADLYGPSVPTLMDLHQEPQKQGETLLPLHKFGIAVMSMGFLMDEEQPVIWRGPLASRALMEFLQQVTWGALDCLVVDLPPGTGDVVITLARAIPQAQVVLVTTPQTVAVADVRRAVRMFQRLGNPVAGIVENMAWFSCGHDEERIEIFGAGGGAALGEEMGIPLLGELPLEIELRASGDAGTPLVASAPDHPVSREIARIALSLSLQFAMDERGHRVH